MVNAKSPQIRSIISQDYFVGPSGLVNSLNNLIMLISIVEEGTVDSDAPGVGKIVNQHHSICTIHISSFNLKDQNFVID